MVKACTHFFSYSALKAFFARRTDSLPVKNYFITKRWICQGLFQVITSYKLKNKLLVTLDTAVINSIDYSYTVYKKYYVWNIYAKL